MPDKEDLADFLEKAFPQCFILPGELRELFIKLWCSFVIHGSCSRFFRLSKNSPLVLKDLNNPALY
jgi:hypothetical protein